jgi:putative glutamine amidotransferase
MQMLNLHLGGKLTATGGHSGERHLIKRTHADAPWEAEFEVNSFHNFAVGANDLAPDLEPMAIAHDETVEACRHKQYACIDIMWHPEREAPATERDIKLLSDFFLRTAD